MSNWQQTYQLIETNRIKAHLQNTENELRKKDTSHLTPEQRQAREKMLDLLHEYWQNSSFPINTEFPMLRLPHIKDEFGTPCAMAYLIESDNKELVKELQESNNIFINEVDKNHPLITWINEHGLTQQEAAQIQPSYSWNPGIGGSRKPIGDGNIIDHKIKKSKERQPKDLPNIQEISDNIAKNTGYSAQRKMKPSERERNPVRKVVRGFAEDSTANLRSQRFRRLNKRVNY